jgi:tripartite-type tricarboxylate transporter receptor subunit TctC
LTASLSRLFSLACVLASPAALAQTYPDRNVTIVVTTAAGALTDTLTRAVAQQLSEMWKQSVIVENRGGAGYSIAAQTAMRAEHDGYTLLASETGFYTTQPHLYAEGKLAYDAEKDFVPVAGYGTIPTALLVNPSVPVNSVSDLIALAKKKPGAVTFGTAGVGSALHIAGLELESLTGIKMTAVHYRGAAPALSDVLAGHINTVIMGPSVALSSVKLGKLKMLAFGSEKRLPQFPDVPDTRQTYRSGCLLRRAPLPRLSRRSTPTYKRSSAILNSRRNTSSALRFSRYRGQSTPLPNIYARTRPNGARSLRRRT